MRSSQSHALQGKETGLDTAGKGRTLAVISAGLGEAFVGSLAALAAVDRVELSPFFGAVSGLPSCPPRVDFNFGCKNCTIDRYFEHTKFASGMSSLRVRTDH